MALGFYKDGAPTALLKIAQPFMAGLSVTKNEKSRRDGRMVLSSLTGLGIWADENPRLKPWAIFKKSFPPARRCRGDGCGGGHDYFLSKPSRMAVAFIAKSRSGSFSNAQLQSA